MQRWLTPKPCSEPGAADAPRVDGEPRQGAASPESHPQAQHCAGTQQVPVDAVGVGPQEDR